MKLQHRVLLLSALLLTLFRSAAAQVQQVAIRTTGISCGVCAALAEMRFRRLPGIDQVTISLAKETIVLTYKSGVTFSPQRIREILQPLEVGVVQLQVTARGRVRAEGTKRFFIAGEDKFVLVPGAYVAAISGAERVLVIGVVNDRFDPPELRISASTRVGL